MKAYKFILPILSMIVCFSCKSKNNNNGEIPIVDTLKKKDLLIGLWSINIKFGNQMEPDKLKAQLLLKEDRTFIYHDENVYGQNFSEGIWSGDGMFIILKSFDKYRPDKKEEAKKNDPLFYDTYKPKDTIKLNFDNVRFTLKNDTLFSIDKRAIFNHLIFIKYNPDKINTASSASWIEFKY